MLVPERAGTVRRAFCSLVASALLATGLLVAVMLGGTLPAQAQWTPRVETRVGDRTAAASAAPGELWVNNLLVLRLRTELGGYLPADRVVVAAGRLQTLIAAGLKPGEVQVDAHTDRANPRIKARGEVVATATADEAKVASMSAPRLAQSWADALRKALAIPGISVSEERMLVPLGETRILRIGGAARGPLTITVGTGGGAPAFVGTQFDPATGVLVLAGMAPGKDALIFSREGAFATAQVAVQPYAGRIEMPRPLAVTGDSAPADLIGRFVAARALAAARPIAGATAQVTAKTVEVAPLAPGEAQAIDVPLLMTGPEMIPVRGTVRVAVANRPLSPPPASTLLYSNNPERVTRYGTLFAGRLAPTSGATRLLYHHQSAMDKAAWFVVELVNDGDTPASVHVVGGAAGPVLDTVWVGYRAGSTFFRDVLANVGAIVEVPARSRVALTSQRLAPGLTVSGLVQLYQTAGAPLLVRVGADIPADAQTLTAELQPTPLLWGAAGTPLPFDLSPHVYPAPHKILKERYVVGERWTFLSIGRVPIKTAGQERRLEGNYGVVYDIELTLENPTDKEATAQIVFEPTAGLAGGVFRIDGRSVEIPQANLPKEIALARYPLLPGAKQTVQLMTMPLSGSNYPAQIVVRP